MCEILLSNMNNTSDDPDKDKWMYKKGDMVYIAPDGHEWGSEEGPPNFYLIKIPDVPVENVMKYRQETHDPDNPSNNLRRTWGFKWNSLPQAILNKFGTDGELIIKARDTYTGPYDYLWEDVRGYIFHKKTDLPEDGEL